MPIDQADAGFHHLVSVQLFKSDKPNAAGDYAYEARALDNEGRVRHSSAEAPLTAVVALLECLQATDDL